MTTQALPRPHAADSAWLRILRSLSLASLARKPSAGMKNRLLAAVGEQRVLLHGFAEDGPVRDSLLVTLSDVERGAKAGGGLLMGWQKLYAVEEASIQLMPKDQQRAHGVVLREQAHEYLSAGSRRAIDDLLPAKGKWSTAEVTAAQQVVNDHLKGVYVRATHARTQLFYLPLMLAAILGALLVVSFDVSRPVYVEDLSPSPELLIWVYVLGALGALLSATLGTIRGITRENYMLLIEGRVNVTRPLLGAASAAAVVAILDTEFLNLAGSNSQDRPLALAVAIVAGFSERLLTNAIAAVVHGSDKK